MTNRYLTLTFSDIFADFELFNNALLRFASAEIQAMSHDEKNKLYLMLYSRFGDSNIRYTNTFLFKIKLFTNINCKYPRVFAWEKDQKYLRETSLEDFQVGGKIITNSAENPSSKINTDDMGTIGYMNAQNTTLTKRGELGVLVERMGNLESGIEDEFLNSFKSMFIQILAPQADLLYLSETEE